MSIKIEEATLADLDALANIEKTCFGKGAYSRENMAYLLEASSAVSLKAQTDQRTVGFIIGLIEGYGKRKMGHVYTLDVSSGYRRMRIGVKLLERLEQLFLEKGVGIVYLEVRADNKAALGLYREKGYAVLEPLENYYSKRTLGLRMKKELKK